MTSAQTQTRADTPTTAQEQDMVVGIFDNHDQATQVVQQLIDAGIPATHISILTQGLEVKEQVQGYVTTGDVARETAGVGAWTGGLFGLLAGAAFLWVPALGPLVILGPLASAAVGALEGGAVGGLLGALLGRQMEKERVPKIQSALQGGKYVVVVHGPAQELETVRRIMGESGGQDVATYPAGAAARSAADAGATSNGAMTATRAGPTDRTAPLVAEGVAQVEILPEQPVKAAGRGILKVEDEVSPQSSQMGQ